MGGGGCCVGDISKIGDIFRNFFGGGGGCGYHPGPSENELHAKKIADELADMKEKIRTSSEKNETQIIDYINRSTDAFIKELEGINHQTFGGKSLNINIEGIREKNERLKKQVVGSIGTTMENRLVLTDRELSVILEERNDKKRAKNFDAFCKRIQKQSLLNLRTKIYNTVQKQNEMIKEEIQLRLDEVDKNMREVKKAYTDIVEAKERDSAKMEELQIGYIYKCALTEILTNQLENEGEQNVFL